MKNGTKQSAAGRRVQAEWAENVAAAAAGIIRADWPACIVDHAHSDARYMQRAMDEKVRKAERKAERAAKAEQKVAAAAKALAEGTVGECQICARQIGTTVGVIAHHGYARPGDGYQTPSCEGARYPSYAESCDRLREVAAAVADLATEAEKALADITANPPATVTFKRKLKRYFGDVATEVVTVTRPDGYVDDGRPTYTHEAGSYRALLHRARVNAASHASGVRAFATELARRLAAWVPPVR